MSLKPGKPLWFGLLPAERDPKLVFGLPGNPVSTLVCFRLFVRPALARLAGEAEAGPSLVPAILVGEYLHDSDRPHERPCRRPALFATERRTSIRSTGRDRRTWRVLAQANCLLPTSRRSAAVPGRRASRGHRCSTAHPLHELPAVSDCTSEEA